MFRRRHAVRGSAGFTLVELMVVIALIGILTALVVPEMRGTYSDAVLRAAGRDLIGVCGLASARAVGFGQILRLRIDTGTGKFRLEKKVGGSAREPIFRPLREISGTDGELAGSLSVRVVNGTGAGDAVESAPTDSAVGSSEPSREATDREPPRDVTFYPDGTADRADIVLRDREGFGLVLRLNPITSRMQAIELKRR